MTFQPVLEVSWLGINSADVKQILVKLLWRSLLLVKFSQVFLFRKDKAFQTLLKKRFWQVFSRLALFIWQSFLEKSWKHFCEKSLTCNSAKNELLNRYFTRILMKFYKWKFNKVFEKYLYRSSVFSKVMGTNPAALLKMNFSTEFFREFCWNFMFWMKILVKYLKSTNERFIFLIELHAGSQ